MMVKRFIPSHLPNLFNDESSYFHSNINKLNYTEYKQLITTINWVKNVIVKNDKSQSEFITFDKFKELYTDLDTKDKSASLTKSEDSDIKNNDKNNNIKNNDKPKIINPDNKVKQDQKDIENKEEKDSGNEKDKNNNLSQSSSTVTEINLNNNNQQQNENKK